MEEIKLKLILKTLEDKKAENIEVFDVTSRSPFFTYFVLATSKNARHMHALGDYIIEALEKSSISIKGIDGKESTSWLVIDCYDILVHIFDEKERIRVDLDTLLRVENEKED